MPPTFPLTIGRTTFAFGVAASADVGTATERADLTIAAIAYGAVTGTILYLAGRLEPRISLRGALLADRLAGILLTAIAISLFANGFTDLRGGRDAHRVTFPSRGQLLVPGCAECASSAVRSSPAVPARAR